MSSTTKLGREVRFVSDKTGLRLIRQSQGEVFMPSGDVRSDPKVPELDYQFQRGFLTVREGQDPLPDKIDPATGELIERDAVEFIREHDWYGTTINEIPRDADAPDPGPLYGQIAELAAKRDIDALVELGVAEQETWAREDVLRAIEGACIQIDPAFGQPPEAA